MFKKISVAAALLCCAAISPAAYADGPVGGAINGVARAGEDIADGAMDAGRDILEGFTGDDTNPGAGLGSTDNNGTTTDNANGDINNGTTGDTSNTTTGNGTTSDTTSGNTSEELASGSNSSTAAAGNPNTGISMGYVASAAVLAAMGVVVTAVKRRDD